MSRSLVTFVTFVTCITDDDVQREQQVLKVLSSEKNDACQMCRGAQRGDLLEIEYTGALENGTVFDGSSITVSTMV